MGSLSETESPKGLRRRYQLLQSTFYHFHFPKLMRIHKEQVVIVVVDVQERLFPHIYEHERLAATLGILLKGARALSLPILVTEQYVKGLGATIPSIKDVLGDFYAPMEKMEFSCCGSKEFTDALDNLGRKFVILTGMETHVCVLQTAMDLLEHGYTPVLVDDCISSRRLNDKHVALERMRQAGGIITTCESILFELCVVAGTPVFKQISALVK